MWPYFFVFFFIPEGKGDLFFGLPQQLWGSLWPLFLTPGCICQVALYAYVAVLMSFKNTRCLLCPNTPALAKGFRISFFALVDDVFDDVVLVWSCYLGTGVLDQ